MIRHLTVALAIVVSAPAVAQAPTPAIAPAYGAPIGLGAAQALVTAALAEATTRTLRCAIAIVEPTGELVAFVRMDDTQ